MKKIIMMALLGALVVSGVAQAQENKMDWEISMQPKLTAEEKEQARWVPILTNNVGEYSYAKDTLRYAGKGKDKRQVEVVVKTVFKDEALLARLQQMYSKDLRQGETVSNSQMKLTFLLDEKEYIVNSMEVYTDTGRPLAVERKKERRREVPEKSFAEAMLEICQQYTLYNK